MKWRALVPALTLGLLPVGCTFLGKPAQTNYYLLDYLPTPPKERLAKGAYPFVLRVREFTIAETYRRSQIVYRQSAHQMHFYNYHLWAVDPERMIFDMVVKHLNEARLFNNITRSVESYLPDFYLAGEVLAIEEYDSKEQWFAHLAIEFKLEDAKTNQVVWNKLYDLRKAVAHQEPVFVIRELSFLLETINNRLIAELDVILDEYKYEAITRQDTIGLDKSGVTPATGTGD